MRILVLLGLLVLALACSPKAKEDKDPTEPEATEVAHTNWLEPAIPLVASLETAHEAHLFRKQKAIAFDLLLYFGGNLRLDARITTTTGSDRIRIDRSDSTTILFYNGEGYQTPADAEWGSARFDLLTWAYFALAPFKLSDPGTNWETLSNVEVDGKTFGRGKLTFGENIGDAPEDWYIAYQDKETNLLDGLAYIVTFRRSLEEAVKNPHAIRYAGYKRINGIPFSTEWTFHNWSQENGFESTPIGKATLSNVEFVDPDPDFFRPLEGSLPIPRERI